jgi:hypothetical protein
MRKSYSCLELAKRSRHTHTNGSPRHVYGSETAMLDLKIRLEPKIWLDMQERAQMCQPQLAHENPRDNMHVEENLETRQPQSVCLRTCLTASPYLFDRLQTRPSISVLIVYGNTPRLMLHTCTNKHPYCSHVRARVHTDTDTHTQIHTHIYSIQILACTRATHKRICMHAHVCAYLVYIHTCTMFHESSPYALTRIERSASPAWE